uniref:Uncharacterized protein n=1 Tax=Amphimedon queenslandica TaxID=400682 RepID=A0A1X7VGP1_AMPQE
MKPMSDLCATCKEKSGLIIRSTNMQSDERITEAMQKALDHRSLVKKEREYYKDVHYPSSPLQACPIYFLTPRKYGIFGVCCEAIPQQYHGLNSVNIHFHADNCTGQNKNNTVIQYLLWRVVTGLNGLNASISISFLPVGHKIFSRLVLWTFKEKNP